MNIASTTLIGPALAWAVAVALGDKPIVRPWENSPGAAIYRTPGLRMGGIDFRPHTDWAHGGPISEQAGISVTRCDDPARPGWMAIRGAVGPVFGATELVAKMRCLVVARLGREVDIPDDLAILCVPAASPHPIT